MPGIDQTPKSSLPKAALRPPQFGLRTLLLVVTACALLAALSQWVTPLVIACTIFFILTVIAHVAGNAIGTRLRELGDRPPDTDEANVRGSGRSMPIARDFAPPTRLGQRYSLGWPIFLATAAGAVAGAVGGAIWTLDFSPGPVGALNVGMGGLAFGTLGGIIAFATFGFAQVGLTALRQALVEPKN